MDIGMNKVHFYSDIPEAVRYINLVEDIKDFAKTAEARHSSIDFNDPSLTPDKDHVAIHLTALGETERWGFNRNGDGFPKAACISHHDTFVKKGKVYEHHRASDPKNNMGHIAKSAYVEPMGRIELVVHAHKDKAQSHLHKLASSGEVAFSMGCFLDGDYPILTRDKGYVGIADVKVGDHVLTHKGNWKRVYKVNRRKWTGDVYTLKFNGLPVPMRLTADHHMMYKLFDTPNRSRPYANTEEFLATEPGFQHTEHIQVNDHVMARTPINYSNYASIGDRDLAAFLGFYLAEGSASSNCVDLACNLDDRLPRVVPAMIERMFPGTTVEIHPRKHSKTGLAVKIYSAAVERMVHMYVGKGVRNKLICPEIFNSADDIKKAFLGAWLDGDGFVDKKGGHWPTCNLGMALQGRDLLASLGTPASIYRIKHKAGTRKDGHRIKATTEYVLNVNHAAVSMLGGESFKAAEYPSEPLKAVGRGACMKSVSNGLEEYTYRIKAFEVEHVTDAPTFNFEVEDDESYVAAGMVSHNCHVKYDRCSICDVKRANSRDPKQCDHVKYDLGKMAEDGSFVGTENDEPNFFDISFVSKPADRIAWSLNTKSASADPDFMSGIKQAEAQGLIAPDDVMLYGDRTAEVKLAIALRLVSANTNLLKIATCGVSNSDEAYTWALRHASAVAVLDDVKIAALREFHHSDTLAALADNGVILDPVSYVKLAMGIDCGPAAEHMEAYKAACSRLFDAASDVSDICSDRFHDVISDASYSNELGKIASTGIVLLNADTQADLALAATIDHGDTGIADNNKTASYSELPDTLAAGYGAYKLSALAAITARQPDVLDIASNTSILSGQHLFYLSVQ